MSERCRPICLSAEDAVELAELLEFLADWIEHNTARADRALIPFVSWGSGYDAADLRADLARFAFLLGGTRSTLVFAHDENKEDDQ